MGHVHENVQGAKYYWEYVKRFGKESSETWWKDFVVAVLLAVIPILLAWGDRTVLQGAILAVEATGLLFGLVALRHLVHTSLILFRERAHPELGGMRFTHWGYGVWGLGILISLFGGLTYGLSRGWLRQQPPVVFKMVPPAAPVTATLRLRNPAKTNRAPADTPKISTPRSAPRTPAAQTPSPMPQAVQSTAPVTFLDRVVQENRGLTPDDRNRLSTELYECDQFIKQSQAAGYKLNTEFGKLTNDRQSGALARNVDAHISFLRDLDKSAWDQYHGLQHFQAKWQYFGDQTEYLFGDNPFNAGEGLLLNAIEGMTNGLTSWSKISNRDQQEILNIEAQEQIDFERNLREFFNWAKDTLQRV